jgi:ribonuclease HI
MKAYTDGACRCGNPGETSCAFAVFGTDVVRPLAQDKRYLGPELHTNNYAEYQGLLDLLKWADKTGVIRLDIYCDSKLVVNQVMDEWDVNSEELKPLLLQAYGLRVRGMHLVHHVKGHDGDYGNEYVDVLCNEALDEEFQRRKNEKLQ